MTSNLETGQAAMPAGQDALPARDEGITPARPKRPSIARSDAATCKCGARWTGTSKCHCSGCHLLFSGVAMFDRHRVNGQCVDPAGIMVKPRDGSPERLAFAFRSETWCDAVEFKGAGELFGGVA